MTQDQAAEEVQALVDQIVNSQSRPAPSVTVQVIPGSPPPNSSTAGTTPTSWSWARGAAAASAGGAGSVSSQVAYDVACPVVIIFPPLAAVQAGMRGAARFP